MKIKGEIEVVRANDNKLIAKGENKFTNIGRQHICNWLLHDNYSDDVAWNGMNPYQGGRSISDMKIIPYTQVNAYKIGTQTGYIENPTYCLYPKNNDFDYARLRDDANTSGWGSPYAGTYNDQYGTIFFEFTTPKNLAGWMLWGVTTRQWPHQERMQIATSPNTFAENINWTVQNVKGVVPDWGYSTPGAFVKNYQLYRFDYDNYPNRILNNVKTMRIRTKYIDNDWEYIYMYGCWFLEANDYPNTPSVIGLGTGSNAPALTDTTLQTESIRKFVRTHKTVSDNQVKYSMRLNYDEGNGVTFNEVGLFANPTAGMYIGGDHQASYCTNMMARGLFGAPWSKTSNDVIDVDYTLTLTN